MDPNGIAAKTGRFGHNDQEALYRNLGNLGGFSTTQTSLTDVPGEFSE